MRAKQELENINIEILTLETLVSRFKSNDEEQYLKIRNIVEEEVGRVLIHSKVLLQFALTAVIET
jgi:hypothetical protein